MTHTRIYTVILGLFLCCLTASAEKPRRAKGDSKAGVSTLPLGMAKGKKAGTISSGGYGKTAKKPKKKSKKWILLKDKKNTKGIVLQKDKKNTKAIVLQKDKKNTKAIVLQKNKKNTKAKKKKYNR